jgi:hypothetical protein
LSSFDTVEIMFEFSKSIRHGLISLESLNDLAGVDCRKVSALADSVRLAHTEATAYMVTLIAASTRTERIQGSLSQKSGSLSSE